MPDNSAKKKREWHTSHADFFKSIFDHLKHIATLASGSILLLSTYLESAAPRPLCGRRPVTQTVAGILLLDEA